MANKLDAVKRLLTQLQASRPAQATAAGFHRYIKAPVQWSGNKVRRSLDRVDDLAKRNRLVRGLRDGLLWVGPTRVARRVLKETARVHGGVAFGAGILGGAGAEFKHLDKQKREAEKAQRDAERQQRDEERQQREEKRSVRERDRDRTVGRLQNATMVGAKRRNALGAEVRALRRRLDQLEGNNHQAAGKDAGFAKTAWQPPRRVRFAGRKFGKFMGDKVGGALVGSTTAFFWLPQLNRLKRQAPGDGEQYEAAALSNPSLQGMVRAEKHASATERLCARLVGERR